jgi:sortase (surface protein transpeptidase)
LGAALTVLLGISLVAAAAAMAFSGPSHGEYLDPHAQTERALAVPDAQAVSAALEKTEPVKMNPRHPVLRQMPTPSRIVIPAIRVSAPLIPLGLNRDRTIQVPQSFSVAGWFRPGPEPGEQGAAVILGHVDSRSGPGVFFHVPALRRGDMIRVILRTRKALQFVVTGRREVPKAHFPTKLVYGRTAVPTLRLITCGGRFNQATGHYVDNFIVFARLVGRL